MRAMDFSPPADVAPKLWTRAEAIACLRESLVKLCGEGHSMCQVAADRGIFCRGFRQWPEREFHDLWKPLIGESTHLSRAQMERFADLWQLSEQVRQGIHARLRRRRSSAPAPAAAGTSSRTSTCPASAPRSSARRVVVTDGRPISIEIAPERPNLLDTDRASGVSFDTNESELDQTP